MRPRKVRIHAWLALPDRESDSRLLAWPLEGMLFDIEHNDFWLPEWGERPADEGARHEIAAAAVRAAPPLIPLYSHRYLPADPHEAGNPVLSVYQTDIIYYGANLEHYLANEFDRPRGDSGWLDAPTIRHIRFWSDIIEGAG